MIIHHVNVKNSIGDIVMFNKKVLITEDSILIGRNQLHWNEIVGIKEYNDAFLSKLYSRFPMAELFVRNGKVVTISNENLFFKTSRNQCNSKLGTDYETCVNILRKKIKNRNPVFDNWISWRVILPCALAEILATVICVLLRVSFHSIIGISLFLAISIVPVSLVWERKARLKIARGIEAED